MPFVQAVETVDLSANGVRAALWADEPLTNVALWRVQTADGTHFTKESRLFFAAAFTALKDCAIVVTGFPDASADLMAEYTDTQGVTHSVLLCQSGRDGRLINVEWTDKAAE